MNWLFDTSIYLKMFDKFREETNQDLIKFVSNLFKLANSSENITLLVPPIIYAEVITNAFYYFKRSNALKLRTYIHKYCKKYYIANENLFENIDFIAEHYDATGGADTLIVAWAKLKECTLITADKNMHNKARRADVNSYFVRLAVVLHHTTLFFLIFSTSRFAILSVFPALVLQADLHPSYQLILFHLKFR